MTMRTWMTVLSAAGLLALGSACVVTETTGTGGMGGMGTAGGGTAGGGTAGGGTAGGGGAGGASAACFKTCGEAASSDSVFTTELVCKDADATEVSTWTELYKCVCEAGGACADVCKENCAGMTPTKACTDCIVQPDATMPSCLAQYSVCD